MVTRTRRTPARGKPQNLVGLIRFPGTSDDPVGTFLRTQEQIVDVTERLHAGADGRIEWAAARPPQDAEPKESISHLITAITAEPNQVERVENLLLQSPGSGVRSALILVVEPSHEALSRAAEREIGSHCSCLLQVLSKLRRYHHRICMETTFLARPREEGGRLLGLFPYSLAATTLQPKNGVEVPRSTISTRNFADGDGLASTLARLDDRCRGDLALADESVVARELVILLRKAGVG